MNKKLRKYLKLYLISLLVGFFFELFLSSVWQYNMLDYFLGVPFMIVLSWGSLLPLGYLLVEKLKKTNKLPYWLNLLIIYIPSIIIIESVGTNILNWQLNKIYPPLIGNFMKAPPLVYLSYFLVALLTYSILFKKVR